MDEQSEQSADELLKHQRHPNNLRDQSQLRRIKLKHVNILRRNVNDFNKYMKIKKFNM